MRVGSLFTGVGGFDLGFERAGFEVAWQCEIDKHAAVVLQHHWRKVPLYGDIRSVTTPAAVDVLVGGSPCQDVSLAGRRAGLGGVRSSLFFEFARILGSIQPEWFVFENVPGLLSSNEGRDMDTVIGALAECGYRWAYGVLDAQYFGVPQERRRLFIVGRAGATDLHPAEVLFERAADAGNCAPEEQPGVETIGTITRAIGHHGYSAGWGCPIVFTPAPRRLTPTEVERCFGFPEGWTAIAGSDSIRLQQLGNAVVVPVSEWLARRIAAA